MIKFTEAKLEAAFIELLTNVGFTCVSGKQISKSNEEVLLKDDLTAYLKTRYKQHQLTDSEINTFIRDFENLPASDLYESNKIIMDWVANGKTLKREDRNKKDVFIELIDYRPDFLLNNSFKIVNQFDIWGYEHRIPDGIVYINGLPLVVIEFKSAIVPDATIHEAYKQLTIRYRRDIPELFKYNAFCVISDGVNNKAGSFFAPYEFYYAWRRTEGMENEVDGFDSMFSLVNGMLNPKRLIDIIHHFIFFPDSSKDEVKIVCRYPQYYAARKLYVNIKLHQRPAGDGKGGTYFGATGCGKSYTMLFLSRLLMKSTHFKSPTIVLITDRTDLDDQLSEDFTNAKKYLSDNNSVSVSSRAELKELLKGRNSGGVFLTTIHKFTEATDLLSERTNIICISDEAHRSQINLELKVSYTETGGVKRTYGFAKYLHDSLPNATYVGFTGTPIDGTIDVFGEIVDAYTMAESVADDITVRLVYEGRAAKVLLDNSKLEEIESYYEQCTNEGANTHQIEASKQAVAKMDVIIGDPKRLKLVANDFVQHYSKRVEEGATVKGKAMFVCSSRPIAFELYKNIIQIKPEWVEMKISEAGSTLTDEEKKEIKPMERVKMIMTRHKDDEERLYKLLGTKEYRKELDRQFKNEKSNFKIAIVVDMWLTGFDVPLLDTIYIDKPLQKHSLIQTISRVNRKFGNKEKGLIVDYFGIKKQMNLALADYTKKDREKVEEIDESVVIVKNHLDLLAKLMHGFDAFLYFKGSGMEQLTVLKLAAEHAQQTVSVEKRFMGLAKRLKAAYDICVGSDKISDNEREYIHFYLAVRSIIFKLTKGNAPDMAIMNAKVRKMMEEALRSDGIEEIFKMGDEKQTEIDLFDADYLAKIAKIKLPHTKFKLLHQLLARAISEFAAVNRMQGIDFTQKMNRLIEKYNDRSEADILKSEVLEDFTNEILDLFNALKDEMASFQELGIDFEEKAFYDILKALATKYDFKYPEDKLLTLAKEVKIVVDDKAKYTDWNNRDDIKAELKVDLIILLANHDYPPVDKNEIYKEIFTQAESFKRGRRSE